MVRSRLHFDVEVNGMKVNVTITPKIWMPFRYDVNIIGATEGEEDVSYGIALFKNQFIHPERELDFTPIAVEIISNSIGPFGLFPFEEGVKSLLPELPTSGAVLPAQGAGATTGATMPGSATGVGP